MWKVNTNMYLVCKEILSDYVLKKGTKVSDGTPKIQYIDKIPFLCWANLCALEAESVGYVNVCIIGMLKLFGITAFYDERMLYIDNVYEDSKIALPFVSNMKRGNVGGLNGNWYVYEFDGMEICEKVGNEINRLLLLLVIDPLAFIFRMRHKIRLSSVRAQKVFGMIERSINRLEYMMYAKYFLVKQLEKEGVVNDILRLVFDRWLWYEAHEIEEKLKE